MQLQYHAHLRFYSILFYFQVEDLFEGVMWDSSVSSPNETTYPILIERQHRALFWVILLNYFGVLPVVS